MIPVPSFFRLLADDGNKIPSFFLLPARHFKNCRRFVYGKFHLPVSDASILNSRLQRADACATKNAAARGSSQGDSHFRHLSHEDSKVFGSQKINESKKP